MPDCYSPLWPPDGALLLSFSFVFLCRETPKYTVTVRPQSLYRNHSLTSHRCMYTHAGSLFFRWCNEWLQKGCEVIAKHSSAISEWLLTDREDSERTTSVNLKKCQYVVCFCSSLLTNVYDFCSCCFFLWVDQWCQVLREVLIRQQEIFQNGFKETRGLLP